MTGSQLRERIIDAATELLQQQGADAVTTRVVAAKAGLQAPTIYRLVRDKDGPLQAVAQHVLATYVLATYVAGKAASGQIEDPVADFRAGWNTHMGFGLANPELFALLSTARHGMPLPAAVARSEILCRLARSRSRFKRVRMNQTLGYSVAHRSWRSRLPLFIQSGRSRPQAMEPE